MQSETHGSLREAVGSDAPACIKNLLAPVSTILSGSPVGFAWGKMAGTHYSSIELQRSPTAYKLKCGINSDDWRLSESICCTFFSCYSCVFTSCPALPSFPFSATPHSLWFPPKFGCYWQVSRLLGRSGSFHRKRL